MKKTILLFLLLSSPVFAQYNSYPTFTGKGFTKSSTAIDTSGIVSGDSTSALTYNQTVTTR